MNTSSSESSLLTTGDTHRHMEPIWVAVSVTEKYLRFWYDLSENAFCSLKISPPYAQLCFKRNWALEPCFPGLGRFLPRNFDRVRILRNIYDICE